MTVAELRRQMTEREFTDWKAFYKVERAMQDEANAKNS